MLLLLRMIKGLNTRTNRSSCSCSCCCWWEASNDCCCSATSFASQTCSSWSASLASNMQIYSWCSSLFHSLVIFQFRLFFQVVLVYNLFLLLSSKNIHNFGASSVMLMLLMFVWCRIRRGIILQSKMTHQVCPSVHIMTAAPCVHINRHQL